MKGYKSTKKLLKRENSSTIGELIREINEN
jgi:hypothetical protein